ncbi:MAG: SPOR domain-containing protein [Planctomycetota bacterium]|jgi:hypothetical protein
MITKQKITNPKQKRAGCLIPPRAVGILVFILGTTLLINTIGCNGWGGGGIDLFKHSQDTERWTINCCRADAVKIPNHQLYCRALADNLKQVKGISPRDVRVVTDNSGSTIYYGNYAKVASRKTGRLVFPSKFQKDIELVRRLSYKNSTPFFGAHPEPLDLQSDTTNSIWEVSNCKGKYTLQIAIFYNTPTFSKRKEAAEKYVKILRDEGYRAYFEHQIVRSHVYVGDFNESDIIRLKGRQWKPGPSVEKFIARKPEEFKYMYINGHLFKQPGIDGKMVPPPSFLVPVPRRGQYNRTDY